MLSTHARVSHEEAVKFVTHRMLLPCQSINLSPLTISRNAIISLAQAWTDVINVNGIISSKVKKPPREAQCNAVSPLGSTHRIPVRNLMCQTAGKALAR